MNLDRWRTRSPLLADLADDHVAFLASVAVEEVLPPDETVFKVNSPADRFYLIDSGGIALRIAGPSKPPITIQTVGEGALLGLSWRLPPYRWQWTAQTLTDTTLIRFDANTVLSACEADPTFDNALLRVVARESSQRLQNVRLQLLDMYGRQRP